MHPDIGFIPTPYDAVQTLLELAELSDRDVVYDLGCGDGRVLIEAARQFNCRGVGIDVDIDCIGRAQRAARYAEVSDRVQFHVGNLYEADVRSATVVVVYLLPHLNLRLRPRLWEQLRPGARVLSHQFDMGDWKADRVVKLPESEEESTIYRWVIDAPAVSQTQVI